MIYRFDQFCTQTSGNHRSDTYKCIKCGKERRAQDRTGQDRTDEQRREQDRTEEDRRGQKG